MKRLKVIRHFEDNGCVLLREGACHSIVINTKTGKKSTLPRHSDIDEITVKKICKQLDIPVF